MLGGMVVKIGVRCGVRGGVCAVVWGGVGRVCGAGACARECVECVDMKILSNIII